MSDSGLIVGGIKNTDAEMRDAVVNDVTKFPGGNVDAEISTRAPSATALSNTTWTDIKAAFLDENISAAKTLTAAAIADIRKSVCLVGDPASSIGKALYDIYITRLTAARAGHLDNINNANLATIADISTLTAINIGYLANINNANLATIGDISTLDAAAIAHLDADISTAITDIATAIADVGTVDGKVDTAIADIGTVDGVVDAIKLKSDLLNSDSGTDTLNDANVTDTIVPASLPTKMHLIFDISTIIVNLDDFDITVDVGVGAAERRVAFYNLTSDGVDITCDTGSGVGQVIAQRRIDISNILVAAGEQVIVTRTRNSAVDRDVVYKHVCGV